MAITASNPRLERLLSTIEKRKETFGKALIQTALVQTENGSWNIGYICISYSQKKDASTDEIFDYNNFKMIKNYLDITESIEFIRTIFDKGVFKIKGYPDYPIKVSFYNAEFVPSIGHYFSNRQWPMIFSNHSIDYATGNIAQVPTVPLSKLGLPLFPTGSEAIINFFGLKRFEAWQNIGNYIEVSVPDYRARIKNLRLSANKVTLEIEANAIEEKKIRAKFFCRGDSVTYTSEDLPIECGKVTFATETEPAYVQADILSIEDNETIDRRSYDYSRPPKEVGVIFEEDERQLSDIIDRGENETVEFKEIYEAKNQREVLETIVAFANTSGGRLFIGVNDNGVIKDFRDDIKLQLQDLVQGNCSPDIKIQVKSVKIGEHKIALVEVPEGNDKPYFYNSRGIFVRRGSSDRQITIMELDNFYAERDKSEGSIDSRW